MKNSPFALISGTGQFANAFGDDSGEQRKITIKQYRVLRFTPAIYAKTQSEVDNIGVLVALAVLVGLWISVRNSQKQGIKAENAWDFGIAVVLAGIVGSKILYVILDWNSGNSISGNVEAAEMK